MLKKLTLINFTAFSKINMDFAKGINVIIGKNSVGKSHLLKVGYILCSAKHEESIVDRKPPYDGKKWIGEKLIKVFNIPEINKLGRKQASNSVSEVAADYYDDEKKKARTGFNVTKEVKYEVDEFYTSQRTTTKSSVCIPPKEVISIYPGLAQAIEDRELSFDHIYYDIAKALGRKPLKGDRLKEISNILLTIEKDVFDGGKFIEKNSQFYLKKESVGELEAPLVAEGLCKVGMLSHLLRNGSLGKGSTLFWDEPESNLNPQLLKLVAKAMTTLADYGIQIVVATHSLFLMRELDILSRKNEKPVRFFGLSETFNGVEVSQGDSIEDIDDIQSLEAELEQSGRYLEMEFEDE